MAANRWALLGVLALASPVHAYIGPPPIYSQFAAADCVVVGRVKAIEANTVLDTAHPAGKSAYQFALVEVTQSLRNPLGLTHLRVGQYGVWGLGENILPVGAEVCLLLRWHATEPIFVPAAWSSASFWVKAENNLEAFDKRVSQLKRMATLLKNPNAGLRSEKAEDRLLTASLLLADYQSYRGSSDSTMEPVDEEQSRLILETLRTADWTKPDHDFGASPLTLFVHLGLTKKQWPRGSYCAETAQAWLKEHAATYRIQRYVPKGDAKK